jgi:hypothetical protein
MAKDLRRSGRRLAAGEMARELLAWRTMFGGRPTRNVPTPSPTTARMGAVRPSWPLWGERTPIGKRRAIGWPLFVLALLAIVLRRLGFSASGFPPAALRAGVC